MATPAARAAASKFVPLASRVLVQRLKPATVTVGGIQLPESAQAKQNVGVVLAVSEDVAVVKVDDQVLLSEYAGTDLKIDEEEFQLFRDEDLLGIMRN